MPVIIEELEVQTAPEPVPDAPASEEAASGAGFDPRALQAALAREAWRIERLAAD